MKKFFVASTVACSLLAVAGAGSALAEPKGGANGYWAGRLCDHVGPTTGGQTYWESRNYSSRGACIAAEGQSLQQGEWDPATLDRTQYPI